MMSLMVMPPLLKLLVGAVGKFIASEAPSYNFPGGKFVFE